MDLETKLTDDEIRQMMTLLCRFANSDLDQFERVKFDTKYGKIFISISRSSGGSDEAFHDITHLIEES